MAGKKSELGPTGATTAHNVKRLRNRQGLTYVDLATRLEHVGRPIPTLGLRRIEAGERRVDVDDLVALAYCLGANPNALLLPPTNENVIEITAAGMQPAWEAWSWARGDAPISFDATSDVAYARAAFEANTNPAQQDWSSAPNVHVVVADGDD